jgi:hypothetical protein
VTGPLAISAVGPLAPPAANSGLKSSCRSEPVRGEQLVSKQLNYTSATPLSEAQIAGTQ